MDKKDTKRLLELLKTGLFMAILAYFSLAFIRQDWEFWRIHRIDRVILTASTIWGIMMGFINKIDTK